MTKQKQDIFDSGPCFFRHPTLDSFNTDHLTIAWYLLTIKLCKPETRPRFGCSPPQHLIENKMLAFLGTLFLAVLVNAQRPEPCGKSRFLDAFIQGFGVYGIQRDFKSDIRCFDAKIGPLMIQITPCFSKSWYFSWIWGKSLGFMGFSFQVYWYTTISSTPHDRPWFIKTLIQILVCRD